MRILYLSIVAIVCLCVVVGSAFAGTDLFSVGSDADDNYVRISSTGAIIGARANVENFTTGDTLTVEESGKVCVKSGKVAGTLFTLPAATAGLEYTFIDNDGVKFYIDPNGTDEIEYSTGTAGTRIYSPAASADSVHLICVDTGKWSVASMKGTWVVDP